MRQERELKGTQGGEHAVLREDAFGIALWESAPQSGSLLFPIAGTPSGTSARSRSTP